MGLVFLICGAVFLIFPCVFLVFLVFLVFWAAPQAAVGRPEVFGGPRAGQEIKKTKKTKKTQ